MPTNRTTDNLTLVKHAYLNNKGRMQGDISSMCVCLFALDLENGGTYEYHIWTANSCDDTDESGVLIFYVF